MSYKEKEDKKPSVLEEPMAIYGTQPDLFATVLSKAGKQFNIIGRHELVTLTREGLPKRGLMALAKRISLTIQEFANIMHISERTLQRYDDNTLIKTEYAEKAVELARLYTRGEEVFGSLEKFKTWMKTPLYVFNGEAPVSLLDTSVGFDIIFRELGRIEHGIFA